MDKRLTHGALSVINDALSHWANHVGTELAGHVEVDDAGVSKPDKVGEIIKAYHQSVTDTRAIVEYCMTNGIR